MTWLGSLRFCFFIAARQLRVRWRSTALTALGVGVALFASMVMYSLMQGFQRQILQQMLKTTPHILTRGRPRLAGKTGRVYVDSEALVAQSRLRPRERDKGIPNYSELIDRVREHPQVVEGAPVVQGAVLISFGTTRRRAIVSGTPPLRYARITLIREQLRLGTIEDLAQRPDGVILGEILADDLGVEVGDRVRALGASGEPRDLRVVALYHSGVTQLDRTSAFVNLRMGQQLHDYPGKATMLVFQSTDATKAAPLARQVEALTGYETLSWQEANENFFAVFRQQNSISSAVILMTLIVAGAGISNGLVTLVLEKRRDIGILKAMGVQARSIALVFVIQGALIGLAGLLVGVPAGAAMVEKMSNTPFPGGRGGLLYSDTFVMLQTPDVYWFPAVFTFVLAIVASYIPSRRAARFDPVDIIRSAR